MVPERAGRLRGTLQGGCWWLKVKLDSVHPSPMGYWAELCQASSRLCLGESFINKLPSFLRTQLIPCATWFTVFGLISEINGQNLPSESEKTGRAREGNREKQEKGFLKHSSKTLLPKMQLPKWFLHLFYISLFTFAGPGQAPHCACCRMWPCFHGPELTLVPVLITTLLIRIITVAL